MKTLRNRDANATRNALLDAAQTIFGRSGFAGARIDEIAELANFNKSLIFQYFTDKSGLYRAVISRFRESSDSAFMGALAPLMIDQSPVTRERVEAIVQTSLRWSFQHLEAEPEYLRLFCWEMAEGWRTFQTTSGADMSGATGLALLNRAQELGIIRSDVSVRVVLAQFTTLPFVTVAFIPRLEGELEAEQYHLHLKSLCEQTIVGFLHAIFPD